ncbi:MAG TPA: VOC family protein, partial [Candidatus Peribacteria bacterium]|nr:VOC family protein [Candidatus Peribacteria bacterium]
VTPNGAGAPGALVKHEQWYKPTMDGPLLYFSATSGDLSVELGRVEKAGGKIWVPRKPIGEFGFIAVFSDTEGNRMALHSRK